MGWLIVEGRFVELDFSLEVAAEVSGWKVHQVIEDTFIVEQSASIAVSVGG